LLRFGLNCNDIFINLAFANSPDHALPDRPSVCQTIEAQFKQLQVKHSLLAMLAPHPLIVSRWVAIEKRQRAKH